MVWFVSGNCDDIVLQVSESGALMCHGGANHEIRPPGFDGFSPNIDRAVLQQVQAAAPSWSICTSEEDDATIDPSGVGLLSRVRSFPEQPHGMIMFFDGPDAVTVQLVLPQARYLRAQRLLELVLQSPSLEYLITIDFLGFRLPKVKTETPTWNEFTSGKPYFFQQSSLTVRRARVDA